MNRQIFQVSHFNICKEDKTLQFIHVLFFAAENEAVRHELPKIIFSLPRNVFVPFPSSPLIPPPEGRNIHSLLSGRLPTAKTDSGSLYPQHFWKLFLSIIAVLSSAVLPSQLIIPFGQKSPKYIFF